MSFYKQFLSNVYLKSKEVEHLKIDGVFHSFTFPIMGIPDAAAKLLQSCLTLCSPLDSSPPGAPVPEILQARTLEWVAISFSNA